MERNQRNNVNDMFGCLHLVLHLYTSILHAPRPNTDPTVPHRPGGVGCYWIEIIKIIPPPYSGLEKVLSIGSPGTNPFGAKPLDLSIKYPITMLFSALFYENCIFFSK